MQYEDTQIVVRGHTFRPAYSNPLPHMLELVCLRSMRQHAGSAYVSIRQHTSAYVRPPLPNMLQLVRLRSIRQYAGSAYKCVLMLLYVSSTTTCVLQFRILLTTSRVATCPVVCAGGLKKIDWYRFDFKSTGMTFIFTGVRMLGSR